MSQNRFADSNDHPSTDGSLVGRCLIASPALVNTPFEKTVILVLQQATDGTFGVILNRPADEQASEALHELTGTDPSIDMNLVHGGPMDGPVFAIHQSESLGEVSMPGGIFVSTQIENLQRLAYQLDSPFRIVLGLAGWQPAQLESEIDNGLWMVMTPDAEQLFGDPEWMWEECVRDYGRQSLENVVGPISFPEDCELN